MIMIDLFNLDVILIFQDLFKSKFQTTRRINVNLSQGLYPAEAMEAATAENKEEKSEQKDSGENT